MKEATLIYPHQLYPTSWVGFSKERPIYLIEEPLFLTEFGAHRQKLLLHRLSLIAYQAELKAAGFTVHYLDVREHTTTEAVFAHLAKDGVKTIHVADTTDDWLEQRIAKYTKANSFIRINYPSELFILKTDFKERYQKSRKHMANFYKSLRVDFKILLDEDNEPTGGQFSFDEANRAKVPKTEPLPADVLFYENNDTKAALAWLGDLPGEQYGTAAVWLPYTRAAAWTFFQNFLTERFHNFGTYEDAIVSEHHRLWHSAISPLLNIGLLHPEEVIKAAIKYGNEHNVPLNNIEGFVRQILGWREFIRASYEVDGRTMRTKNFFNHKRPLPNLMWTSDTALPPLHDAVGKALATGYNHHIERLMVLGNFLLLAETDPDQVYRWFMAMYVDAYDWVMVPNVYGMSQFADGGIFATKPYIAGSNYLKKMSDYPKGEWETVYTALYWHFIKKHEVFFLKNHRLTMMPRLFAKLPPTTQAAHLKIATDFIKTLER